MINLGLNWLDLDLKVGFCWLLMVCVSLNCYL